MLGEVKLGRTRLQGLAADRGCKPPTTDLKLVEADNTRFSLSGILCT